MNLMPITTAKPWGKDKRLVAIAAYSCTVCTVLGGAGAVAAVRSISRPDVMLAGLMALLTALALYAAVRHMLAFGRCGRNITVAVVGALTYVMIMAAFGVSSQNFALVASGGFVLAAAAYFMSPHSQQQFNPPIEDDAQPESAGSA